MALICCRQAKSCEPRHLCGGLIRCPCPDPANSSTRGRYTQGARASGWSARDRALNRIYEELHDTSFVSDETWAVIAAHFTDKQIIELLTIIGSYHEVAYVYNALRVRLIAGSLGLAARAAR